MAQYELIFDVDDHGDDVVDLIYERFDALFSRRGDVSTLVMSAVGPLRSWLPKAWWQTGGGSRYCGESTR